MTEREFLTVSEFVERHKGRIKKDVLYDMVRRGKIVALPIGKGRNFLIPSDALDAIYQEQLAAHQRAR